jgi:hypothetical protein
VGRREGERLRLNTTTGREVLPALERAVMVDVRRPQRHACHAAARPVPPLSGAHAAHVGLLSNPHTPSNSATSSSVGPRGTVFLLGEPKRV